MADDQATLGSFTDDGAAEATGDDGDAMETAGSNGASSTAAGSGPDDTETGEPGPTPAADGEHVCPWCLAGRGRFVETGPTGLACGRCSGALPVGADWFDAHETVARRPMYETDG